jgi:hypothetical protein
MTTPASAPAPATQIDTEALREAILQLVNETGYEGIRAAVLLPDLAAAFPGLTGRDLDTEMNRMVFGPARLLQRRSSALRPLQYLYAITPRGQAALRERHLL